MRTSADASSAVERSRGSFNSLAAPRLVRPVPSPVRRARNRLDERKGLPGLQRGVLVVAFSRCECRRRSRRGFRTFAQAERHLRADRFHIGELRFESRFRSGSDGRASSRAALASSYLPNCHSAAARFAWSHSHADSCAERRVDPIALVEMREGLGIELLVVAEQDADAGMRRRQSRRVAGLLRQFQLLGKGLHGDCVFAFVAIRTPEQNQGVGCFYAIAGRLEKLQRRLEMRDGLIEAALLGAQAAQGEAGPCFQPNRLVLACEIQSLLKVRARVGEFPRASSV